MAKPKNPPNAIIPTVTRLLTGRKTSTTSIAASFYLAYYYRQKKVLSTPLEILYLLVLNIIPN